MKLSEVPPHIKALLLSTCDEDAEPGDWDGLTADELAFVYYFGTPYGSIHAWLHLCGYHMDEAHRLDKRRPQNEPPWGDETLEFDEPLPALTLPKRIATDPALAGCHGWKEASLRGRMAPATRDELLRARFDDLFERELHFGLPVPDFDTWAAGQTVTVPLRPPRPRGQDGREVG